MEEESDGSSEDDDINRVLSLSATSQTLQVTYLIISLVLSVGCGLLLIFVVWKKRYLHKPSHYLRCNLAVDDIIFTSCLIPIRIHALLRQDVGGEHLWCMARLLVGPPCLTSMAGTYLMMAVDLYHFVCNPLHYHDKVTTKRVVAGILTIRAYSLFFGIASVAFGGLPKYSVSCELESVSFTDIFKAINFIVGILATLYVSMLYCLVFKEAKRQQERDENRNLWVFQTKAFKLMLPHVIVWTVLLATVSYNIAMHMERALISKDHMSQNALIIANHVSILLYLTVSSMANPILYSFRLPEFRQAFKELCGLPTNTPPAVPARRHRDMEMAAITGPGENAPASELTPAQTPEESLMPPPKDASFDQAQKQTTTADMSPGLAPCMGSHGQKTASGRPFQLKVQAEVHAVPTPGSSEDISQALPGQLHLDEESSDIPTSMLDTKTDEATVGHTLDVRALENPPGRPKIAWQEDTSQRRKSQP
uniref:G-protein coupled receptors family 1 profile domain-containing protein n=1 Tax=Branchiostoma floridae TaxID=7739 RepID=C3XXA3_BRAFL|eukprot:XP_002611353.1 hypothetical protein BRAFLDRAFT_73254 [Branchiostoma floridae]